MSTALGSKQSWKRANRLADAAHITPAMARGVISRNPDVKPLLDRRSVDIQSILDKLSPKDHEALPPLRVPSNGPHRVPSNGSRQSVSTRGGKRRQVVEEGLPEDLLITVADLQRRGVSASQIQRANAVVDKLRSA